MNVNLFALRCITAAFEDHGVDKDTLLAWGHELGLIEADIWDDANEMYITGHTREFGSIEFTPQSYDPRPKDENKAKGGYARAASLSPSRRSEIALNAAQIRWGTKPKPPTQSQD